MTTDAQLRANQKQDATRKRVAIWLEPEDARQLDKLRGGVPRATYIRALIQRLAREAV